MAARWLGSRGYCVLALIIDPGVSRKALLLLFTAETVNCAPGFSRRIGVLSRHTAGLIGVLVCWGVKMISPQEGWRQRPYWRRLTRKLPA